MSMISFAQNQEDVLLRRAFPDGNDGFYIDVGANDPVWDSVTKHFYDLGWYGINIEPGKGAYDRLCADRKNDINLNIGLSNCESTFEFTEFPSSPGLSTFSPDMAGVWRHLQLETIKRTVPVMTLAQVCDAFVDRPIDFLKIDTEGHEREVIEGGDWHRWRPRVILVEAVWPERWEHLILAADYVFAIFDGLNRYYVRTEDSQLISALNTPVNPRDDYVPFYYHHTIEQLNARLGLSQRMNDELSTRLGYSIEQLNGQLGDSQRMNNELSIRLGVSQRINDDLSTQLGASQSMNDELNTQLGASQSMNDELNTQLALYQDLGPNAIGVARRIHRMAASYPRLSSAVKRIARIGA
jgi:FkbM family methyltransferase